MIFRRITSEGLAHHSYFVADRGEAAVVDPRRDVDVYIQAARDAGARIKWVLETHRHEDFVCGAAALARLNGATALHGRGLDWGHGTSVSDGDEFGLGRLKLRAVATPGHTDEGMSFALSDARVGDDAVFVFTGDTLFIGDVGRTDLYGPAAVERLATALYRSIHDKLLALGDGVIVCPAHGAGSVCGGAVSDRDHSTLGYERAHNAALAGRNLEAFVAMKRGETMVRPPYFLRMEEWNKTGNAPIVESIRPLRPLGLDELDDELRSGVTLIDARMPQAFAGGHIPGALNVWLRGVPAYLPWAAPVDRRTALVLPEDADVDRVARMLLRIGYDDVAGYLCGGFEVWQNAARPFATLPTISSETLRERQARGDRSLTIVDVRKPDEWAEGSIPGARTIFVGEIEQRLSEVPQTGEIVTMCSVGHRGSLAASILARHGRRAANYLGGYNAWKQGELGHKKDQAA